MKLERMLATPCSSSGESKTLDVPRAQRIFPSQGISTDVLVERVVAELREVEASATLGVVTLGAVEAFDDGASKRTELVAWNPSA